MTIEKLLRGLKENYPEALHPTEIGERDLGRCLLRLGYDGDQLEKLYLELLASCEYFPKVYDIHKSAGNLRLEKKGNSLVERTRRMLEEQDERERSGGPVMSLREWLWENGGWEQTVEDCGGDMRLVRARLRVMGREPGCDDDAGEYESLGDL